MPGSGSDLDRQLASQLGALTAELDGDEGSARLLGSAMQEAAAWGIAACVAWALLAWML